MGKTAIVILAAPEQGDESIGRVLNALAAASDFHAHGDDVQVLFAGAGTRWPGLLAEPAHPLHGLFDSLRGVVEGACSACAAFFGATDDVKTAGVELVIGDNRIEGLGELPSLADRVAEGYTVLTF